LKFCKIYNSTTYISEQILTRKNTIIQREILTQRIRKNLLLNILKQIRKIININSIAHARTYILEKVNYNQRREYIDCKIKDLPFRPENSAEAEAGRRIFADIINKKANKEMKYTRKT
jgi:hypothetical protein